MATKSQTISVKFDLPDHGQVNWTVIVSDDVESVSVSHTNVLVGRKAMQDERDAGGSKLGISVCQDGTNFYVQIDLKDIKRAKKK